MQSSRASFDRWVGKETEKEMATHSSILACRIPWTEEPGGLQSKGLQKSQIPLKLLTHLRRPGKTKPKDLARGPNLQHSLCDLTFSFPLCGSQHSCLSVRVTCASWESIPGWSSSQTHCNFSVGMEGTAPWHHSDSPGWQILLLRHRCHSRVWAIEGRCPT